MAVVAVVSCRLTVQGSPNVGDVYQDLVIKAILLSRQILQANYCEITRGPVFGGVVGTERSIANRIQ